MPVDLEQQKLEESKPLDLLGDILQPGFNDKVKDIEPDPEPMQFD